MSNSNMFGLHIHQKVFFTVIEFNRIDKNKLFL